jgi:hypothetical protein
MPGLVPDIFIVSAQPTVTLRGLDPRILFAATKEDAPVKPGQGETGSGNPPSQYRTAISENAPF